MSNPTIPNKPIKLFVGLGNPGERYSNTRHNAGQWFVERLSEQAGATFSREKKLKAHLSVIKQPDTYRLLIPDDFMNCCGAIIRGVLRFYQIAVDEICIIHDELDLEPGIARLKFSGGHGGHNGLRDCIQQLSARDFWRLRIGIGHPGDKNRVSDFVLKPPSQSELALLNRSIDDALYIVPDLLNGDFDKAMRLLHQS